MHLNRDTLYPAAALVYRCTDHADWCYTSATRAHLSVNYLSDVCSNASQQSCSNPPNHSQKSTFEEHKNFPLYKWIQVKRCRHWRIALWITECRVVFNGSQWIGITFIMLGSYSKFSIAFHNILFLWSRFHLQNSLRTRLKESFCTLSKLRCQTHVRTVHYLCINWLLIVLKKQWGTKVWNWIVNLEV